MRRARTGYGGLDHHRKIPSVRQWHTYATRHRVRDDHTWYRKDSLTSTFDALRLRRLSTEKHTARCSYTVWKVHVTVKLIPCWAVHLHRSVQIIDIVD